MRGIYSAFIRNKDHFLLFFFIILSSTLLLNSEDPRMGFIRGKFTDVVKIISSPITWIEFLLNVED